jgi:uncharacterized protein YacL
MKYIKNIFFGVIIGTVIGFFIGTIFEYKVSKKSNWEEKQQMQQVIFSVLGGIGGLILGVKISDEESDK